MAGGEHRVINLCVSSVYRFIFDKTNNIKRETAGPQLRRSHVFEGLITRHTDLSYRLSASYVALHTNR